MFKPKTQKLKIVTVGKRNVHFYALRRTNGKYYVYATVSYNAKPRTYYVGKEVPSDDEYQAIALKMCVPESQWRRKHHSEGALTSRYKSREVLETRVLELEAKLQTLQAQLYDWSPSWI
ncbi:MAG TPA: hypothetical protein DCE56_06560 [Cyanobacteria bacterium UBA8553]|nr:hypothetical protein [Cyanobacteria bacterium UBA8553]HAJ59302.1 hypothetical protein [Cyanobacteria bacterium UBA8543]